VSAWIWGRHPVAEALRAGTVRRILIATGREPSAVIRDIRALASEKAVPVKDVPTAEIARVAPGQNTQGVVAEIEGPRLTAVRDLLSDLGPSPLLLALDQVQDPHNLGALLRTADAAGVAGVILPERRSAPLSGVVAKTSAGTMSRLAIAEAPNLARALDEVRKRGIWTVGLDGTAQQALYDVDLTVPLLLVIGGEGEGLRRLTRERCDFLVHLPMFGHVESLNASVAGSIAMYEVVRQRVAAGLRP